MPRKIILASGSPRRRELLTNAGYTFEVVPAEVEENHDGGETPVALVERLALSKAEEVARRYQGDDAVDAVVLGADTVVVLDGNILGKPGSPEEAQEMLASLSGREHEVITGVALVQPGDATRQVVTHENTTVFFRELTEQEIADYTATGEPLDKAGAYAIQGIAGRFVTRLEGCYFNVMGLPVALVDRLLREWETG